MSVSQYVAMLNKALVIIALLGAAGMAAAEGEPLSPSPPLSLTECINLALTHQTDVRLSEQAVESARARETGAKSDYYPQVTLQYSTDLVTSGTVSPGGRDGASLGVTQNFYDGGVRETRVRRARADVSQSLYGLERARQAVIFATTGDYFALLRAKQLAEVQDARVAYLEGQLALIQARAKVGAAAEVDALPVEAQLANARVDQLSARNAVRTAAVGLQHTMGLAPRTDFAVQDVAPPPAPTLQPLNEYVEQALGSRPDVRQAQAGVQSAQSGVTAARIALRPRAAVAGQFDQPLDDGRNSLLISGSIVYDIFNGSRNRASYREAQAALTSAELRAAQVENDIRADVQNAYLNIANARERLSAADLGLRAAQRNFDAQEERYRLGMAIPLDLLNAQVEVVTAQSNVVQARYDLYTSVAQLEFAIGKQGGVYGE